MVNKNNTIKKIIDPKSGFTLYLRNFSDTPIAQVSTHKSFPIPDPSKQINLIENIPGIETSLNSLKEQTNQLSKTQETNLKSLQKRINQQTGIIVILCLACIASIFF